MPRDTPPAQTGASIRLEGIGKAFGGASAVHHMDLTIAAGQFCVLLGPSGCGKTTCLRIVAGLETADRGRIWIGGRDVTALPPAQRGLAMVFQSYALFPHMTVHENIQFGLRARSVPPPERTRRVAEAAGMLGITALLDRKPGQLSGGQQQRVALGRAIVAQAPVCLMDEPLSNLDAQLRAEMRREILNLQRRLGLTMLYVTHDQTEAMGMADQVVLLRAGRVEQDAAPDALYDRPDTVFAAGFIGQPPMNLVPGAAIGLAAHTAGLRPEALHLADAGIAVQVTHAEYLGADSVLTTSTMSSGTGQATLLVRVPGRVLPPTGTVLHLAYAPQDLHSFNADGRRI